jgi:sortase A
VTRVLTRQAKATEQQDAPHPAAAPRERSRRTSIVVQVAIALTLLLGLLLGFAGYLYGLSALSEHRAQTNLRKTFAKALGQAVAPVGPVPDGTPVAVIDIPTLSLDAVVIEGTSARMLTQGPGHRADTVLPGQVGVSVIYGRRATFGAPFAHLMRLNVGDIITTTTGQGVSTYRVSSFGDSTHPAPANSANRLVLATADSTGWPHETVTVSADLVSKPQPNAGQVGTAGREDQGLASGADDSLLPLLLWSQALLLIAIAVPFAMQRWSPAATYVCAVPIVLTVLWNLYENLACLLPNVY